MFRWLFALFVLILIVGILAPKLSRWLWLGRLPGDVALRIRGRIYHFPFASTVLLSLLLTLAIRYL